MGKEKPGNNTALKPFRWWQGLWRSVFGIDQGGTRWDIDVDFFDVKERVALYRDGRQVRTQVLPARFTLDDGATIEVRTSMWGMRRAHLVLARGGEQQLTPVRGSSERWRADLERRHPVVSRAISTTSLLVLLAVVTLQLPQGIEWLADVGSEISPALPENMDQVAAWFEAFSFTSPWHLDGVANTMLGIVGALALLERALRLRYSWWLDGLEGMDGSWSN